jgi:hypothetical protein
MTKHRKWAPLRDEIAALTELGLGLVKLGRLYGLTHPGMAKVLRRLGLSTKGQRNVGS